MDLKNVKAIQAKLLEIDRALGLYARNEASCCGVTLSQCHTIMAVGMSGETNVKDLSSVLGLDKSTLSRTIDGLVSEKILERTASTKDRRAVVLKLAQKGQEAFDRINFAWTKFCNDLLGRIPEDKHAQVLETLSLILNALPKDNYGKVQITCCK